MKVIADPQYKNSERDTGDQADRPIDTTLPAVEVEQPVGAARQKIKLESRSRKT